MVSDEDVRRGGGIWLNGLRSYPQGNRVDGATADGDEVVSGSEGEGGRDSGVGEKVSATSERNTRADTDANIFGGRGVAIPKPIPGFEERIAAAVAANGVEKADGAGDGSDSRADVEAVLAAHKSFLRRKVMNQKRFYEAQVF